MSHFVVVVDNAVAARIMERVLGDPRVRVENAEERSGAMESATRILFYDTTPTVLLLDSDSLEERAITEEQLEIGGYLRGGSGGHPNRLVLAIPQVEAVLFSDRAGLENALGKKIEDDDFFEARFRPKAVFQRLLGKKNPRERALAVIDRIDETSLRRMAAHPVIREIRDFIDAVERGKQTRSAKVRRAS
ncbi:MAG TPA: hypothetical protein VFJ82_19650 [Longimicrobium sp.]|nr:hypothetical protein [Longimicrobium sp.]